MSNNMLTPAVYSIDPNNPFYGQREMDLMLNENLQLKNEVQNLAYLLDDQNPRYVKTHVQANDNNVHKH